MRLIYPWPVRASIRLVGSVHFFFSDRVAVSCTNGIDLVTMAFAAHGSENSLGSVQG